MLTSELAAISLTASSADDKAGLIILCLRADHERLHIEVRGYNPAGLRSSEVIPGAAEEDTFTVLETLSYRWGFTELSRYQTVAWCEILVNN